METASKAHHCDGRTANAGISWLGPDAYEVGDELYERATSFFERVNWTVLASRCSDLRHGILCKFGGQYSMGHYNLVRLVVFVDGISWVAQLRLPPLPYVFGDREKLDGASVMKAEVACMRFLR